jgi:hypothetical protein
MATVVPGHRGGGWSSEAPASMRLRSPALLRYSGASLCSSSGTGGEASWLSRRFMNSVRMCRSRAGPGPVFRVADVRDKRILSVFLSWLSAAPARRTAQGGRVALCGRAPAVSAGSPAVRLSELRWWRPSAGELRNVVEVAGFA